MTGLELLGFVMLGVMLFRLKAWLRRNHVPVLPAVCDRLAILFWDVNIGNHTVIGSGLQSWYVFPSDSFLPERCAMPSTT